MCRRLQLIKKDTLVVILVGAFIVLPAMMALAAFFITKNPNFRPLSVTIEKLADAGLIAESGEIIAVVSIGAQATKHPSKKEYAKALRVPFERYNSELRVKFRTVPRNSDITVTYLVGLNKIGPYAFSNAASGIKTAVRAERMLKAHNAAALKKEQKAQAEKSSSWFRFFEN
jgi:hypothetical protein